MSRFHEWSDDYLTGNLIIDQQHQQLFNIINDLHTSGNDSSVQKQHFLELKDFALKHFMTEEEIMLIFGYPEDKLKIHRREHQHFISRLEVISNSMSTGETTGTSIIMIFLKSWLIDHVLKENRDLIKYLAH